VIYQIYPRSFQDSNGDGIGDLIGIASGCPISPLGADAIWISPFFTSPMKDFGYDVSDYTRRRSDVRHAGDFAPGRRRPRSRHLKVMIDLVLSHTSDQHPWFAESRSNRDNHKADWYVWADPSPMARRPTTGCRSSAARPGSGTPTASSITCTISSPSQPDLNFHNPEVQERAARRGALLAGLGVDGFRLDTINFYFHDKTLRTIRRCRRSAQRFHRAGGQPLQLPGSTSTTRTSPENLEFLKRFRAVLDEFPAPQRWARWAMRSAGWRSWPNTPPATTSMHMCYSFEFLAPTDLALKVRTVVDGFREAAPDGWACWAFSNHDVVRHATRWGAMSRSGSATCGCSPDCSCPARLGLLYQGEELGLPEADIAYEDLQDPYGIRFWPKFKGRDGCRTPMVWASNEPNGGFTTGEPWLPVPDIHRAMAVDAAGPRGSVYEFYRASWRSARRTRSSPRADRVRRCAEDVVLSMIRDDGNEAIFCAFNLGQRAEVRV
jgi:alpha-glucosidase